MEKVENITNYTYRDFFVRLFLIGLIVFSGIIFLYPKLTEAIRMRKEVDEAREKLAKLTLKATFLEGVDEYELTAKTRFLFEALPAEGDTMVPLAVLRILASQFNLQIQEVRADLGGKEAGGLYSVAFSLKMTGDRKSVGDFIEKIGTTLPLMTVEDVNISLSEGSSRATVKIKAFFLGLPKEMEAVESPLPLITSGEEKSYQRVSGFTSILPKENPPSAPTGKETLFEL